MNTIYLALGSNLGNRYAYMQAAIAMLASQISKIRLSNVYETRPWGETNQNTFLNMAIRAETRLTPHELLAFIQKVQAAVGRIKRQTNGPREIDIDILLFEDNGGSIKLHSDELSIPHPRINERDFVLLPLSELNPQIEYVPSALKEKFILKKYIPTQIVGIMNLSPESFGSKAYTDIPSILRRIETMVDEGADIVDIGAQSTRPGAIQLTEEEELARLNDVIPSIKARFPNLKISIDTTRLACMREALAAGVNMINDIAGMRFAPEMASIIAKTANAGTKIVCMHSQGSFDELHKRYQYGDIMESLMEYFREKIATMLASGIRPEQIILDPGIGFSKGAEENFEILRRLDELKSLGFPVYIGLSRKKFIGTATGRTDPEDRDIGSTALHTLCMQNGIDYIRTHNVSYAKEAKDLLQYV